LLPWLGTLSLAQKAVQAGAPEHTVATAFEQAVQTEGGRHLKQIYSKHIQHLCVDGRRWGDGIIGYARFNFSDQQDLSSEMLALVHRWKTTGSQEPPFDPRNFPKLRRYSVANCGVVGGEANVVVATYRSAWDTYWANWGTLLGK
jgi:hypothetical protein